MPMFTTAFNIFKTTQKQTQAPVIPPLPLPPPRPLLKALRKTPGLSAIKGGVGLSGQLTLKPQSKNDLDGGYRINSRAVNAPSLRTPIPSADIFMQAVQFREAQRPIATERTRRVLLSDAPRRIAAQPHGPEKELTTTDGAQPLVSSDVAVARVAENRVIVDAPVRPLQSVGVDDDAQQFGKTSPAGMDSQPIAKNDIAVSSSSVRYYPDSADTYTAPSLIVGDNSDDDPISIDISTSSTRSDSGRSRKSAGGNKPSSVRSASHKSVVRSASGRSGKSAVRSVSPSSRTSSSEESIQSTGAQQSTAWYWNPIAFLKRKTAARPRGRRKPASPQGELSASKKKLWWWQRG